METPAPRPLPLVTIVVALVIMLSGSVIGLWFAYSAQVGVAIAWAGLVFNLLFGAFLFSRKQWAKEWILARYVIAIAYAIALAVGMHLLFYGLFEVIVAISILWLLGGKVSKFRAYSTLGGYAITLVAMTFAIYGLAMRAPKLMAMPSDGPQLHQSQHDYQLSMEGLEWVILTPEQSQQLLGSTIADADLKVVRQDGSSFGLFFPLTFNNTPYQPELATMLEMEIREKWLTNLHNWHRTPVEDGFILTAEGDVQGTPVSYVVFYKHFGNMGVYAVFWAESHDQERLVDEAEIFYSNLSAEPLKERLSRYSSGQIYEANSSAVVLINVFNQYGDLSGRGTGFNISPEGLIVTNLHVLLQGRGLQVAFPDGKVYDKVKIVGLSPPELDLALVMVEGGDLPAVNSFKTVPVAPGDPVYVIGNPKGLVNSLSEGIVGAVRDEGEMTLYQITAPIASGSSGGPVFNEYGEVIGVANSVVVDAEHISFSISIDELQNLYLLQEPISLSDLMEQLEQ